MYSVDTTGHNHGASNSSSYTSLTRLLIPHVFSYHTDLQVVRSALDKPINVTYKGVTDLVTDTDKASEAAILDYLHGQFPEYPPPSPPLTRVELCKFERPTPLHST
jgi:myo-inositol-1(or 4)-monophosphatase